MHRNIKEIAKLRGSEDLWEVAKLHDHESLFPKVRTIQKFESYSDICLRFPLNSLPF